MRNFNHAKEQAEKRQKIAHEIFTILKNNHLTLAESDMILDELRHIIRNQVRM